MVPVQFDAAGADPAASARRIARHQGMVGNVPGHHGPGSDKCESSDPRVPRGSIHWPRHCHDPPAVELRGWVIVQKRVAFVDFGSDGGGVTYGGDQFYGGAGFGDPDAFAGQNVLIHLGVQSSSGC